MPSLSNDHLEVVIHRLNHYRISHGNLPLFRLPRYSCCLDQQGLEAGIGYQDMAQLLSELVELRENPPVQVPAIQDTEEEPVKYPADVRKLTFNIQAAAEDVAMRKLRKALYHAWMGGHVAGFRAGNAEALDLPWDGARNPYANNTTEEEVMTQLVDDHTIEQVVGIPRQQWRHIARAVSAEQTVYILHSRECFTSHEDLRTCSFSRALDNGIDADVWADYEDRPVFVDTQLQPNGADFKLVPTAVASDVLPYRRVSG